MTGNATILPPPTPENLVAFWPVGVSVVAPIAVVLAVLYLLGAVALWRRGRRWSALRTISFLLGCGILFLTGSLGLNQYAEWLVGALVFQQITLMTVVPPLLIVGSPGRLILRATPHRGIGRVALRVAHGGLRSRVASAVLHPAVAIMVAAALYLGLYLTDLVSVAIALPAGHELLLMTFLVGGIVAAVPLWSSDPLPRAPSYAARLADVGVELQIHAIFGLVLLRTPSLLFSAFSSPPPSWSVDPLFDQAVAGTLAWTYAELPLFVILIVTLARWGRRDAKLAARHQPRHEADLEEYNAYLASLERRGSSSAGDE
ncbi:cytochrome c oxidase assembly protein [Tersicoccus sp. MR15.9]|uniref:cytochrome c oxidase assembly protein n=1 Tax=Tersicoccus mangrovi TaxID=3121635 RepID=UPI0026990CDC